MNDKKRQVPDTPAEALAKAFVLEETKTEPKKGVHKP